MHYNDDNYLTNSAVYPSSLNLPPPLPFNQRSAELLSHMQKAYSAAYIKLVDANALGWNAEPTILFKLHADLPIPIFSGDFDYAKLSLYEKDRPGFWAYSIVFAYEPASSEDGDPDEEGALKGNNPKYPFPSLAPNGLAVIYPESIRDELFGFKDAQNFVPRNQLTNTLSAPVLADLYKDWIYGTAAHELGHSPGKNAGFTDHAEGGLMVSGGSDIGTSGFSGKTILRFRKSKSWTSD